MVDPKLFSLNRPLKIAFCFRPLVMAFLAVLSLGLWQCKTEDKSPDPEITDKTDMVEYTLNVEVRHEDPDNPGEFKTSMASDKFSFEEEVVSLNAVRKGFRKVMNELIFDNLPGTIRPWEVNGDSGPLAEISCQIVKTRNGLPDPIEDMGFETQLPEGFFFVNGPDGQNFSGDFDLPPNINPGTQHIADWSGEFFFDNSSSEILMTEVLSNNPKFFFFSSNLFEVEIQFQLMVYDPDFKYSPTSSGSAPEPFNFLKKEGSIAIIKGSHQVGPGPCPTKLGDLRISCDEEDYSQYYFRIENGHPGLDVRMNGLNNTPKFLMGEFNPNDGLGYFSNESLQKISVEFNCKYAADINHNYTIYVYRIDKEGKVYSIKEMTLNVVVDVI